MYFKDESALLIQKRAKQIGLDVELHEVNSFALRTARCEFEFEQRRHFFQGGLKVGNIWTRSVFD